MGHTENDAYGNYSIEEFYLLRYTAKQSTESQLISEACVTSIFRIEEQAKQETGVKAGGSRALHNHCCENLKHYSSSTVVYLLPWEWKIHIQTHRDSRLTEELLEVVFFAVIE
jgi:hypothetical protein